MKRSQQQITGGMMHMKIFNFVQAPGSESPVRIEPHITLRLVVGKTKFPAKTTLWTPPKSLVVTHKSPGIEM